MEDRKQAILATKKENYESWGPLKKGCRIIYKTKREAIVDKLSPGDIIYIKIQGDGRIKIKTKVVKVVKEPSREIDLEVLEMVSFSTHHVFNNWVNNKGNPIWAGCEHSWVKDTNGDK